MIETYVTNRHLMDAVREFQKYLENDEDAPQELFIEMMNELKVSNLLIPASIEGDTLNFEHLISEDDDSTVIPLFSDDNEFKKQYGEDYELDAIACDFDYYLELIESLGIDGILINSANEEFLIESELLFEYPFGPIAVAEDDAEACGKEELLEIARNARNESLLEFIKSGNNHFEALMLELEKSTLLDVVTLDEECDEEIVSCEDGFEICTTVAEGEEYGILFTSVDAINQTKDDDENYYCQLVLLDEFFELVLTSDMDGIIINPDLDDYLIPRSYILEAYGGLSYTNPKFKNAIDYAFTL